MTIQTALLNPPRHRHHQRRTTALRAEDNGSPGLRRLSLGTLSGSSVAPFPPLLRDYLCFDYLYNDIRKVPLTSYIYIPGIVADIYHIISYTYSFNLFTIIAFFSICNVSYDLTFVVVHGQFILGQFI
jgi:hypothetical protein